jgi:hypothetical protein
MDCFAPLAMTVFFDVSISPASRVIASLRARLRFLKCRGGMIGSMIKRRVFLSALLAVGLAAGAPARSPAQAAEPLCVFLLPDSGSEVLLNRCGGCREVTLQRVREGEGIPNVRSLMLPGEAAASTPFRGPGRTRIIGERTCPPPPGRNISEAAIRR